MKREVTVTISLTDDEMVTLERLVAEQQAWERQHVSHLGVSNWTEQNELCCLLHEALTSKAREYQKDNAAAAAPVSGSAFPITELPAWLAALDEPQSTELCQEGGQQ
jgi:hypothetical protein